MPREIYEAVGNVSGTEGELGFLEQLREDTAQTGDRLAVADATRGYACPECSHPGQLPPVDDLRRLAMEQGRYWPDK